ncbi:SUMF1/EgtB/PvdO family nonheme iron enzyme [Nostoc sp.]|uniref:SUMF1/EgtB/PvdO family nonheme iron enzyme n=1 Tax=Nostoc sp. TaxID=1180 RepID=UPI002FEFAAF9
MRNLQQQLGLKNEDFAQIERSIREPAEARYQEKLKQQAEAERQRQIELEQRKQAEAKHKAQEQAGTSQATSLQNSAGNKLRRFEFDVITVNKQGEEKSRTKKSAEFFSEDLGNGVLLEMVKIPSGTFQMGSPEGKGKDDEKPQHTVTVPAFLMGKYPVTQAQWRRVAALPKVEITLKAEPSNFKGDSRPVEQVSWNQAVEFCQRLSVVTGHSYRLPSEAEWEYACRAGTMTKFYFGETLTPKLARCKANLGMDRVTLLGGKTASVGSYLPNAFGLYDMHGNVSEWCADRWHDNYASAPTDGTAWIMNGNSEQRIRRGGSWKFNPANCRAAYRLSYSPALRSSYIGFRVVCSVVPGLL